MNIPSKDKVMMRVYSLRTTIHKVMTRPLIKSNSMAPITFQNRSLLENNSSKTTGMSMERETIEARIENPSNKDGLVMRRRKLIARKTEPITSWPKRIASLLFDA